MKSTGVFFRGGEEKKGRQQLLPSRSGARLYGITRKAMTGSDVDILDEGGASGSHGRRIGCRDNVRIYCI
jgi:hypothetical protein